MARPTVCFFAKVPNRDVLRRVEFYVQDLRILDELGYEVRIATRTREIVRADLYFIWWWTWSFLPLAAAALYRRPSIITGTLDWPTFHQRPRLHQWLMRSAIKHCSANVFVSEFEFHAVTSALTVANPHYVPHVIDTGVYSPDDIPREDFIFTISWLQKSNFQRKCIPEIIRAIPHVRREHPNVRFVIVGEHGPHHAELLDLARSIGCADCLDFPGVIPPEEKIRLLRRCKIYLQPSRYEGFGLAILEAMGCAAPVISSPVGAVPEVVGDAALLTDGSSPEAIAAAVNQLLHSPDLQRQLGERGRCRAESLFSFERRKAALRQIVEKIRG